MFTGFGSKSVLARYVRALTGLVARINHGQESQGSGVEYGHKGEVILILLPRLERNSSSYLDVKSA